MEDLKNQVIALEVYIKLLQKERLNKIKKDLEKTDIWTKYFKNNILKIKIFILLLYCYNVAF